MADEEITMNFKYGSKNFSLTMSSGATLQKLREELHKETGRYFPRPRKTHSPDVLPALQKIMYKGTLSDNEKTLKDLKITHGAKMVLLGTKIENVMAAASSLEKASTEPAGSSDLDKPEEEVDPNEGKVWNDPKVRFLLTSFSGTPKNPQWRTSF